MRRIGIVTINDENNYGNRLQLYAMTKVLGEYGSVEDIVRPYGCEKRSVIRLKLREVKNMLKSIIKQILKKGADYSRHKHFVIFSKKNVKKHKTIFSKNTNYKRINDYFDYIVAGSDQIWNPNLFESMYINLLAFVDANKKVAIAPSIATDKFSEEQAKAFKHMIRDFKYISCREEQGAALLESVTGKEVTSLLDPTLMLSDKEWDEIIKKPVFHDDNKKYIFLYFLGTMTEGYTSIINSIKEKYGLEVINVLDKSSKYYSCGPSEFVYLIKNSQLVLTDSFHGSVFSYIYNRPFRIFYRQGEGGYMNSRLTNLMNKLNLDESIYLKEDDCLDNIMSVSYDKKYLESEQKKFNDYLQRVFEN